jgi:hypothetical protein
MWWPVIFGILAFNSVLAIVHFAGPKSIVLTWIPGRILVLVISLASVDALQDMIRYTWASSIIPVTFLVIFHTASSYNGRLPRFGKANCHWAATWIVSVVTMAVTIVIIGIFGNDILYLVTGIIATLLNIVNVTCAPQHIEKNEIKFTPTYIVGINVLVFGVLFGIHELIGAGELVWAGILSNIPLLAMALIAGATCIDSKKAVISIHQHVYMLSYQIWPNMAILSALWVTRKQLLFERLCISLIALIIVISIQYLFIKSKL